MDIDSNLSLLSQAQLSRDEALRQIAITYLMYSAVMTQPKNRKELQQKALALSILDLNLSMDQCGSSKVTWRH